MAERTFAGFRFEQRLSVGFYGEVYRGEGSDGAEVDVLRTDSQLASLPKFANALIHFGRALALLKHDNMVATRMVGKAPDGSLTVVSEPVANSTSLFEILAELGDDAVPMSVALSISVAITSAIAYAHSVGLCHGGVHPRSVLIAGDGAVKLGDFAAARALAAAAAGDPSLLEASHDFLSPELMKGIEPKPPSDVFSVGLLIEDMFGDAEPPASISSLILKATHDEPAQRFTDGGDMLRALDRVLTSLGAELAGPTEVRAFARSHGGAVRRPATPQPIEPERTVPERPSNRQPSEVEDEPGVDDVLASLAAEEAEAPPPLPVTKPPPVTQAPPVTTAQPATEPQPVTQAKPVTQAQLVTQAQPVTEPPPVLPSPWAAVKKQGAAASPSSSARPLTAGLPTGPQFPRSKPTTSPAPMVREEPAEIRIARAKARAALAEAALVDDGEVTRVEPASPVSQTDPISEIIALDPNAQPASAARKSTPAPAETPGRSTEERAVMASAAAAVVAGLDDDDEPVAKEPSLPSIGLEKLPSESLPPEPAPAVEPELPAADQTDMLTLKRGGSFKWVALSVFVLAGAIGYLYFATDTFHPERAAAKAEARERERLAEEKRLKDAQTKPGTIVVKASEEGAAVWLLLGRTPFESFPLPASQPSDLRFELDGFKSQDIALTGPAWSGGGEEPLKASLHARMESGKLNEPLPPYPAEPEKAAPPGPEGTGVVRIESTPPGAQAWLLVGFTPEVTLAGIGAGKNYEIKLLKTGFKPGFVVFRDVDWYLSGEVGQGKLRPQLQKDVTLIADPSAAPAGKKKTKKKSRR